MPYMMIEKYIIVSVDGTLGQVRVEQKKIVKVHREIISRAAGAENFEINPSLLPHNIASRVLVSQQSRFFK